MTATETYYKQRIADLEDRLQRLAVLVQELDSVGNDVRIHATYAATRIAQALEGTQP